MSRQRPSYRSSTQRWLVAAKRTVSSGIPTPQVATVGGGDHASSSWAPGSGGRSLNSAVPPTSRKEGKLVEESLEWREGGELVGQHLRPVTFERGEER